MHVYDNWILCCKSLAQGSHAHACTHAHTHTHTRTHTCTHTHTHTHTHVHVVLSEPPVTENIQSVKIIVSKHMQRAEFVVRVVPAAAMVVIFVIHVHSYHYCSLFLCHRWKQSLVVSPLWHSHMPHSWQNHCESVRLWFWEQRVQRPLLFFRVPDSLGTVVEKSSGTIAPPWQPGHCPTTIIPNELSCKLQTELSDWLVPRVGVEVLVQNEAVRDRDVKKEVIDVLIKLPTLGAAAVVASQLVTVINCTHQPVVQDYTLCAGNWNSGPILLHDDHNLAKHWPSLFSFCTVFDSPLLKGKLCNSKCTRSCCICRTIQFALWQE